MLELFERRDRIRVFERRLQIQIEAITPRFFRDAAPFSTLYWFEIGLLTKEENLIGLMA